MSTTPVPAQEVPAQLSAFKRIFGVFFSPTAAFQDIARKPSWLAPMAILILISIGLSVSLGKHADWIEISKDQIAKSKFAARQFDQLSEDQKSHAYEQAAERSRVIRYVRGVIGWPMLLVIMGSIYLGVFKLIGGGRTNFVTAFAIAVFGHLPVGLKELISIPVVFLKDPASIDPENFLASNPAAIFSNTLAPWQLVPLAFLDVFSIWALVLVAIGFSASDPKKLPFGKSLGLVFGVTLVFMFFFTGLAWAFS
jgi:hypothetical protein